MIYNNNNKNEAVKYEDLVEDYICLKYSKTDIMIRKDLFGGVEKYSDVELDRKITESFKQNKLSETDVFKQCKNSLDEGDLSFFPITLFFMDKKRISAVRRSVKNDKRTLARAEVKEANCLNILIPLQNGPNSTDLRCCVSGDILNNKSDIKGKQIISGEGHHMSFRDNRSDSKLGFEPSDYLREKNLCEPNAENHKYLDDALNLIYIRNDIHSYIHAYCVSGDIDFYPEEVLPYCVKSKENWDKTMEYLDSLGYDVSHFGSYEERINRLKQKDLPIRGKYDFSTF